MQLTNVEKLICVNQCEIPKAIKPNRSGVMRFALLLGLIFQTFMMNYAAAESTATGPTVPGGYRLETFGGYSYFHFNSGFSSTQGLIGVTSTSMGMNGWTIAGTYNVTNYFGATAEFSGQYAGDFLGANAAFTADPAFRTHVHNFLFGPTLTYRKNTKITPFARILVGDSRGTILAEGTAFSITRDALGLAAGGGVDYKIGHRLAVRLAQFDYIHTSFNFNNGVLNGFPTSQNHFRYSAGIVIKAF
jgi:hypothetical protein